MRSINYQRWEYHEDGPELRTAPLWAFVFDVPYLATCGVFPPLHVLNQFLQTGGFQGGMGPGATWEPFELAAPEYQELVKVVLSPDRVQLAVHARYSAQKLSVDPALDHIQDRAEWTEAAAGKHRDEYRKRIGG